MGYIVQKIWQITSQETQKLSKEIAQSSSLKWTGILKSPYTKASHSWTLMKKTEPYRPLLQN